MKLSNNIWSLKSADDSAVSSIVSAVGIGDISARLMVNRGIFDPPEAASFLKPDMSMLHDPLLMKDMVPAAEKLYQALLNNANIAIYGDYDVDGITSTAILMEFLKYLTPRVRYFIPERLRDGYGIKKENLAALRFLGTDLIITVDCGVSSHEEIRYGKELGLDFIVTDHHHPSSLLPQDVPVINPQREGCLYPNKNLAGAGVVFKLIQGVKAIIEGKKGSLPERIRAFNLNPLLEMAAIGSIGDVVPLKGENRVLTSLGLDVLRNTDRPGLVALKEISGVSNYVNASSVAFYLAPRLNSSGRLGRADRGVQLFLEQDPYRAREMAWELNKENNYRQKLEKEILRESKLLIEESCREQIGAIFLSSENWHPGVIGIVASRLVDLYHRPAILMAGSNDNVKGSIRSIPECPLPEILKGCSEYLTSYGGHRLAAGFVIHRNNLDDFRMKFNELSSKFVKKMDSKPTIHIDTEIDFKELKMNLLEEIARLEPFGNGNPPPLFLSNRVYISREPEVFGNNHLRLCLKANCREIKGIWFKMGHLSPYLWKNAPVNIVYTPELKRYRNGKGIFLNIRDISTDYQIENAPHYED